MSQVLLNPPNPDNPSYKSYVLTKTSNGKKEADKNNPGLPDMSDVKAVSAAGVSALIVKEVGDFVDHGLVEERARKNILQSTTMGTNEPAKVVSYYGIRLVAGTAAASLAAFAVSKYNDVGGMVKDPGVKSAIKFGAYAGAGIKAISLLYKLVANINATSTDVAKKESEAASTRAAVMGDYLQVAPVRPAVSTIANRPKNRINDFVQVKPQNALGDYMQVTTKGKDTAMGDYLTVKGY